ncbi:MAG: hypothetical protein AAFQ27_09900, partial [Pseudomonadota bacterium]
VIVGAFALSSCGSEQSGTITDEDGETVTYSVDGEGSDEMTTRITGPDGEEVIARSGADVAVNLPDGFSMYPGAKVVSNTTVSNNNDGNGSMIMFESEASPKEIAEYYRGQAEKAGITIQIDANMNGSQMIAGENEAEGTSFMVTASRDEGEMTSAQMMIGTKLDQ